MVIDSHCHIFPASFQRRRDELVRRDATFAALFSNPKAVLATAETLLESMDRDGVDRSIVVGIGWNDPVWPKSPTTISPSRCRGTLIASQGSVP